MRIEFHCDDGSFTVCQNASLALMHWWGRQSPPNLPENPEPFGIYVSKVPTAPGNKNFLTLVVGAIERRWNQTPDIEITAPGDPGYEDTCLAILRWLEENGDITELTVREAK